MLKDEIADQLVYATVKISRAIPHNCYDTHYRAAIL